MKGSVPGSRGGNRLGSADFRRFADTMRGVGWTWAFTGNNHVKWTHPEVVLPIFTANTPRSNGVHKERQKLATALRRAREAGAIK